ncbi:hypothetical protein [Rhizobium sp. CECT 9324]|jgi:hypothetical protein|uniref:hypothetical protein n=1 Tax=Rhizobium sp. CECT 9324 TaxID=2845820 RepID=UPI001E2BC26F|nr:hypothetical protein [Rhizobium sp. CECT 9324]CAH0341354.1 hypothetical protein RHI9324_03048 [Rhizobium sp. CECT 9324]
MIDMLRKLGIAALVSVTAVTGLAATATTASADSFGIYIGGPAYGVDYRDGPRHWDRGPRGHDRDGRGRGRGDCRPNQAVEKAQWSGLRRARIMDITPRRVVVEGVRRGDFDRMVFANVRGCPVIRY